MTPLVETDPRLRALEIARTYSYSCDAASQKAWVIDQIVRALTGCPVENKTVRDYKGRNTTVQVLADCPAYLEFVHEATSGETRNPWDEGVPPSYGEGSDWDEVA